MGGNLFKDRGVVRASKQEYLELCTQELAYLKSMFPGSRVEATLSYEDKESYGDLDVLVEVPEETSLFDKFLERKNAFLEEIYLSTGEFEEVRYDHSNHGGISSYVAKLQGKKFQVDVVFTKSSYFEFSRGYFAYNDLGQLMGVLYNRLGFKLGHDGLFYTLRIPRPVSYVEKKVPTSLNFRESVEMLGLDYATWEKGFKSLEEIFAFVSSSPYFHPDFYDLSNRTAAQAIRDRKRSTYTKFLEWLAVKYPVQERSGVGDLLILRNAKFQEVCAKSPATEESVIVLMLQEEARISLKSKFNGGLVQKWTGLEGKALGLVMGAVRAKEGFGDSLSQEEIRELVLAVQKELGL